MRRDRGFTLIEVIIALTLGAVVVLLAHGLFTGVADGATHLTEARQTLDRDANARRWLAAVFGSLDVGSDGGGFAGEPSRVEFGTWQLTQQDWFSKRRIALTRSGTRLVAIVPLADTLVLSDNVTDLQFDYLLDVGSGGQSDSAPGAPGEHARFVREWLSPVSAPIVIRVRIAHTATIDTLLLIVGPRG
jgi:prepilin-type N-terminal cleavage/methylation domain-containing protein